MWQVIFGFGWSFSTKIFKRLLYSRWYFRRRKAEDKSPNRPHVIRSRTKYPPDINKPR